MLAVHNCPACAGSDSTPVFEYNGLVLLDYMRDTDYSRYHYRLCHTCGLVYASRRPEGEELTFLYSRFDEFLGREDKLAYSADSVRDHLAEGWLRSEEEGAEPLGADQPRWRLLRAHNKWQELEACSHHPFPGSYPVVVTDKATIKRVRRLAPILWKR